MSNTDKKIIGENIKSIRKYKRITQKQLAKEINLSEQAVSQYERGEREPSIEILKKIAAFFDTTVTYLTESHKLLGERLTAIREKKKLTIYKLSEKLNIPESIIIEYENSKSITTAEDKEILFKISDYLGVDPNYLLGETDFKFYENLTLNVDLEHIKDLIIKSKKDYTRIIARDIIDSLVSTLHGPLYSESSPLLFTLYELYSLIHKLDNTMRNDLIDSSNEEKEIFIKNTTENFYNLGIKIKNYYDNPNYFSEYEYNFDEISNSVEEGESNGCNNT